MGKPKPCQSRTFFCPKLTIRFKEGTGRYSKKLAWALWMMYIHSSVQLIEFLWEKNTSHLMPGRVSGVHSSKKHPPPWQLCICTDGSDLSATHPHENLSHSWLLEGLLNFFAMHPIWPNSRAPSPQAATVSTEQLQGLLHTLESVNYRDCCTL